MSLMLIAALQAAAAPPAPQGVARSDFDLADVRPAQQGGLSIHGWRGCARSGTDEILVCGRRPTRDEYPIEEMERRYEEEPLVAEMSIGGTMVGRAFVDSVALDRGAVSTRAMVGVAVPF
jgi:hypothetical protein